MIMDGTLSTSLIEPPNRLINLSAVWPTFLSLITNLGLNLEEIWILGPLDVVYYG